MRVQGIKDDIKGILFDMDGLLVNSENLYWEANIQAAKEANLGTPDRSEERRVGKECRSRWSAELYTRKSTKQ